jgi:hypothetical protein
MESSTPKIPTNANETDEHAVKAHWSFWNRLEREFRDLQAIKGIDLRAQWSSEDRKWHIASDPDESRIGQVVALTKAFEAAAASAAMDWRGDDQAIISWLDLLKRETAEYQIVPVDTSTQLGNSDASEFGVIRQVCEVSADYCNLLANRAANTQRALRLTKIDTTDEQRTNASPLKSRRGRKKGTGSQETRDLNIAILEAKRDGQRTRDSILDYLVRKESTMPVPLPAGWRKKYGVKTWYEVRSKAASDTKLKQLCTKRFSKVRV